MIFSVVESHKVSDHIPVICKTTRTHLHQVVPNTYPRQQQTSKFPAPKRGLISPSGDPSGAPYRPATRLPFSMRLRFPRARAGRRSVAAVAAVVVQVFAPRYTYKRGRGRERGSGRGRRRGEGWTALEGVSGPPSGVRTTRGNFKQSIIRVSEVWAPNVTSLLCRHDSPLKENGGGRWSEVPWATLFTMGE